MLVKLPSPRMWRAKGYDMSEAVHCSGCTGWRKMMLLGARPRRQPRDAAGFERVDPAAGASGVNLIRVMLRGAYLHHHDSIARIFCSREPLRPHYNSSSA